MAESTCAGFTQIATPKRLGSVCSIASVTRRICGRTESRRIARKIRSARSTEITALADKLSATMITSNRFQPLLLPMKNSRRKAYIFSNNSTTKIARQTLSMSFSTKPNYAFIAPLHSNPKTMAFITITALMAI